MGVSVETSQLGIDPHRSPQDAVEGVPRGGPLEAAEPPAGVGPSTRLRRAVQQPAVACDEAHDLMGTLTQGSRPPSPRPPPRAPAPTPLLPPPAQAPWVRLLNRRVPSSPLQALPQQALLPLYRLRPQAEAPARLVVRPLLPCARAPGGPGRRSNESRAGRRSGSACRSRAPPSS